MKKKEVLTEYDIFLFRMESSIEWLKYERKKLKYNLNSYRLFFEKVKIEKCLPTFLIYRYWLILE